MASLRASLATLWGTVAGDPLAATGAAGFVLKTAGAGLALVTAILLARAMGPHDFGLYSVAIASAVLAGTLSGLGLPLLVTRAVAAQAATAQWGSVKSLIAASARITSTAALSVAVAGAVLAVATRTADGLPLAGILAAAVCVPILSLNAWRAAVVRGFGHPVFADIPEQVVQPVILLVVIGLLYVSNRDLSPSTALFVHVLAAATALAVGYALLTRAQPLAYGSAAAASMTHGWMQGAWASLAVTAGALFDSQLALYVLGWLRGAEDAGHFQAARQVVLLVSFGLVAITLPLQPRLAAAWAQGDMAKAQILTTSAARIGFGFALVASLVLVPLAEWVLGLYGAEYRAGANALRILLVGQLVNAAAGPCGVVLGMTGHIHRAPPSLFIAILLNAAIAVLSVPSLGPTGAALAACAGVTTYNVAWAWRAARSTGLYTPAFRWRR